MAGARRAWDPTPARSAGGEGSTAVHRLPTSRRQPQTRRSGPATEPDRERHPVLWITSLVCHALEVEFLAIA